MNEPGVPEWLTVSQAAAAVGVSEKTLRKRIARGQVKAQRETLPTGGWGWKVSAAGLEPSNRFQPREGTLEGSRDGTPGSHEGSAAEGLEAVTEVVREVSSVPLPTVPTGAPEVVRERLEAVREVELLREDRARDREQINFLRAALEARDRDAAELRAALRAALQISQRALPESRGEGREESAQSAPNKPVEGKDGSSSKGPQNSAAGRESGFWMRARRVARRLLR
jgi:hypothetical protein